MIEYSAIKFWIYNNDIMCPIILTGKRHADIHEYVNNHKIPVDLFSPNNYIEGFLTHDNRFLTRTEARWEALKCGQILSNPDNTLPPLYSEDIWPED